MTGRTSEASWRGDCLWVGGFCVEFVSDTWPAKERSNVNGEMLKEWGGEDIGRKKPELTLQSSGTVYGSSIGIVDCDLGAKAPRRDRT